MIPFMLLFVALPERIPASPPIGGFFWSYVVPVALFLVALGATWRLYRRFSRR